MKYTVERYESKEYGNENHDGKNLYGISEGPYKDVKFIIENVEINQDSDNELLISHEVIVDQGLDFSDETVRDELNQLIGKIILDALAKISDMQNQVAEDEVSELKDEEN